MMRTKKFYSYFSFFTLLLIILWTLTNYETNYMSRTKMVRSVTQKWPHVSPQDIDDATIVREIAEKYPNMPLEYWAKVKDKIPMMFYRNASCARFPNIFNLNIESTYWQTLYLSNSSTLHLYSAYYDTRKISSNNNFVRILTMINRTRENFNWYDKFYCQLWFDGLSQPVISPITTIDYGWREFWKTHVDGSYAAYLLGCVVPNNTNAVPKVVTVVEKECHSANNMIKIIYNKNNDKMKKNVTVCVKGLDFLQADISIRLVEWIESVLLMGVEKIHFYQFDIHTNIKKVLDYYIRKGKVDVRPITLPPGQPNIPYLLHTFLHANIQKSLNEIITYNDCFYRHMYDHKYIMLLDTDEIIVPLKDENWNTLLERMEKVAIPGEYYATLNVRNAYYLDKMTPEGTLAEVPSYMHMLQHVYRSYNYSDPLCYIKSFFNTEEVLLCHNHLPFIHSNRSFMTHDIPIEFAQMNHYRKDFNGELQHPEYFKKITKDPILWKYKNDLISRVNKVLSYLNRLPV